jgi:hypothetical protein
METRSGRALRHCVNLHWLKGQIVLALLAISIPGFQPGITALYAAETNPKPVTLQEVLASQSVGPARLTLVDGSLAVGRVVKIDDDALTIRRPSGGLRVISLGHISELKIKTSSGDLIPGKITRLADGGLGWASLKAMEADAAVASRGPDRLDKGGPLVKLDLDHSRPSNLERDRSAEAKAGPEIAALEPQDSVAPVVAGLGELGSEATQLPLKLEISVEGASENDKLIYFRLTLSEPAPRSILVIYTMINGSAIAPDDYTHRQGTIVFQPGEKEALIATTIKNDDLSEGPESFQLFVSADPQTVVIDNRLVTATIEDDDSGGS